MEEKSFAYQALDCLKNYECGELIFFILSKDAEIYVNHDDGEAMMVFRLQDKNGDYYYGVSGDLFDPSYMDSRECSDEEILVALKIIQKKGFIVNSNAFRIKYE